MALAVVLAAAAARRQQQNEVRRFGIAFHTRIRAHAGIHAYAGIRTHTYAHSPIHLSSVSPCLLPSVPPRYSSSLPHHLPRPPPLCLLRYQQTRVHAPTQTHPCLSQERPLSCRRRCSWLDTRARRFAGTLHPRTGPVIHPRTGPRGP